MKSFTANVMTKSSPVQMSLQARFRASLALAGMNVGTWAVKHGYSQGHVYEVLRGKRHTPDVIEKMERFISRYLPEQKEGAA